MDQRRLRKTIASAKAGDAAGYAALLEAYGPRLYGYFLRATGSHHDAEDLLGALMLRLVERLKSYDERGRFDQWVFRIAANMVRDRIRRAKAAPAVSSLSVEDDAGRDLAERIAGDPDASAVEARMLAAEAGEKLQAALEKLDVATRQVILLRHFGRMSFKELAELLQLPLGTVLARAHRGLRTLRKWMDAEDATE